MSDFKGFSRNLRSRADRLNRNLTRTMKEVIGEILETVVKTTPADEGTAKSNWQVGIPGRPTGILPAYVPGKKGSTAKVNENAAIDKGAGVIAQYVPGNNVHLTNNLPYIGLLNDGSSSQAPAGFVEQAVLRGRESLKRKRKLTEG